MTKLHSLLILPIALVLAGGCDDKKADDKKADDKKTDAKGKTDAKKTDDKKAPEGDTKTPAGDTKAPEGDAKAPDAAAAVEPSPDMKKFLAGFDGTSDKVEAALKEFGSTDEIKGNDMGMWNLKDPKVIAANGDCFTFEAGSGMTVRSYEVCWAAGKIKSIADKGMK